MRCTCRVVYYICDIVRNFHFQSGGCGLFVYMYNVHFVEDINFDTTHFTGKLN